MSVDFYMACTKCKEALHVAQDGLGGFNFYSGMPECMAALGSFLGAHALCQPGAVQFLGETAVDDDLYKLLDTSGNPVPGDDTE